MRETSSRRAALRCIRTYTRYGHLSDHSSASNLPSAKLSNLTCHGATVQADLTPWRQLWCGIKKSVGRGEPFRGQVAPPGSIHVSIALVLNKSSVPLPNVYKRPLPGSPGIF